MLRNLPKAEHLLTGRGGLECKLFLYSRNVFLPIYQMPSFRLAEEAKRPGCGLEQTWIQNPTLLIPTCMTLNKLLQLSKPHFHPQYLVMRFKLVYGSSTVVLIRYGNYQFSKLTVRTLHLELRREEYRFTSHKDRSDNEFLPQWLLKNYSIFQSMTHFPRCYNFFHLKSSILSFYHIIFQYYGFR